MQPIEQEKWVYATKQTSQWPMLKVSESILSCLLLPTVFVLLAYLGMYSLHFVPMIPLLAFIKKFNVIIRHNSQWSIKFFYIAQHELFFIWLILGNWRYRSEDVVLLFSILGWCTCWKCLLVNDDCWKCLLVNDDGEYDELFELYSTIIGFSKMSVAIYAYF